MSQVTRRLVVLVSALVIMALALSAVGSVLAQEGDATTQGSQTVVIGEGDTLADLFDRYNVDENDLDRLANQNAGLRVQEGQTVTFPEGAVVDTTVVDDIAGSPALQEGDTTGDTATTDETVVVQDQAGVDQPGFACDPLGVNGGETYQTQAGDTLGRLLRMMGYDYNVIDGTVGQGQARQQNLVDFINLNCELSFEANQQVVLPALLPVTGQEGDQEATATPEAADTTSDTTGAATTDTTTTDTTTTQDQGDLVIDEATTLGELIDRYNLTTDEEIAAFVRENRALRIEGGQTVTAFAGSIPQTGAQESTTQETTTQETTTQDTTQTQTGQQAGGGQVTSGADAAGNFPSLNLHLGRDDVPAGLGVYIVRGGDSLSSIARNFGTDIQTLRSLNPNTLYNNGDVIFSGQRIYVPGVENPPGGWQNHLLNPVPPSQ